jgi:hypothetical protein
MFHLNVIGALLCYLRLNKRRLLWKKGNNRYFLTYVRVKLYHREIWQRNLLSSLSQPLLNTEMKEK